MSRRDCLRLALRQARGTLLRSAICVASVAVGVCAMLLIVCTVAFGRAQVREGLDALGVSGLTVYLEKPGSGAVFSAAQADALEENLPVVARAMAIKAGSGQFRTGHEQGTAVFFGVDERLGEGMRLGLLHGSLFRARQIDNAERVAVIDASLAQRLFRRDNVVGKELRLVIGGEEQPYKIIGVISSQASLLSGIAGPFMPNMVYVPYTCLATDAGQADQIFIQCIANADLDAAGAQVERFLCERQQVGGEIAVKSLSGALDTADELVGLVTLAFFSIAAIAFVIAMLGVCGSLLAAADERRPDIGIFLAIGARRKDITRIFLYQSMSLCLLGGLLGSGAGCALLWALAQRLPLLASIPLWQAAVAFPAAAGLGGTVCGLLPALRASRLDPIEVM